MAQEVYTLSDSQKLAVGADMARKIVRTVFDRVKAAGGDFAQAVQEAEFALSEAAEFYELQSVEARMCYGYGREA